MKVHWMTFLFTNNTSGGTINLLFREKLTILTSIVIVSIVVHLDGNDILVTYPT